MPEPRGAENLSRLHARLGWWDRALTAPSRAARGCAAALAAAVVVEPALRDCDYGSWTGLPMAEVEARDPDGFAVWLHDPDAAPHGGESLTAVLGRLRPWLGGCAATPGACLAVASPFVARALVVAALELPLPVFWRLDAAPLAVSRLTAQAGRWRLAAFNLPPEQDGSASPGASLRRE